MVYVLLIGGIIFAVVVISLCKAAGNADERHANK